MHAGPLTSTRNDVFIFRNWYHTVETGLAADTGQSERLGTERAEELIERLAGPDFRSARMLEMTRNPLLLTNLCLVHRDRGGLPRGRHQLYDECIEVLLERWRENKALPVHVSAATGRRVLQPVALWLHEKKGRTRASVDELAPIMEPALEAAKWGGGDAAALLRTVRDENGLLTGWGPDQYGFMHLGFQEYLAACELRRKAFEDHKDTVLGELASHYGQSWWQEVILLLLAQGNPSLFAPFVQKALRQMPFKDAEDLLELVLEEAVDVSARPFLELLEEAPGRDAKQWARQGIALRVLEGLVNNE